MSYVMIAQLHLGSIFKHILCLIQLAVCLIAGVASGKMVEWPGWWAGGQGVT